MEKDSLACANQRFLEERIQIEMGMRICRNFESFLKRLKCINKDTQIIQTDWNDHEEWQYKCYYARVKTNEQEKSNKTK
jgi:hypothetical protein